MNTVQNILNERLSLAAEKIEVFLYDIRLFNSEELYSYLSDEETQRANKLKINLKRKQFVISRGLLRVLLSSTIQKQAQEISIHYEEKGKPFVQEEIDNKSIEFNISHSNNYVLIAITLANKVGVDIEAINPGMKFIPLAKRFFSEKESSALLNISEETQCDTFYRIWARKESFIKVTGEGVSYGLDKFSVSIGNINDVPVAVETKVSMPDRYFTYALMEPEGYKTALTTTNKSSQIVFHE